jgi:K+/H+ antiporter YhaU regulatory subunit KhtT
MNDHVREMISIGDEIGNLVLRRVAEGANPYVIGHAIGEALAGFEQGGQVGATVVGVVRERLGAPAAKAAPKP